MSAPPPCRAEAADLHAAFRHDVLAGLARTPKSLAPKWLYDARGSTLFEAITALPEYYPTRVERSILEAAGSEVAAFAGPAAVVVEYGAGSGDKAVRLLAGLDAPSAYVCLEIDPSAVASTMRRVRGALPALRVETRIADFTQLHGPALDLPEGRRVGFFPGSTLGNFEPIAAARLLRSFRDHLGPGSRLLLGIDREKPEEVLLPAYDDPAGVTAAFNLNLLVRMNRDLGADFDLGHFVHEARWNRLARRVEMHLVARSAQTVQLAGRRFHFAAGESLHTENSYKHDDAGLAALVRLGGWREAVRWEDDRRWFCVLGLL